MRLIDIDALIEEIDEEIEYGTNRNHDEDKYITKGLRIARKDILSQPTIDQTNLALTAKWEKCDYKTFEHGFIETHYGKGIYCTNCRYGFKNAELKMRNFCPSCGAKMKMEE